MAKPIKVFYSPLTGRFYASSAYRIEKNGTCVITGKKDDVTDDIASVIVEQGVTFRRKEGVE